jgi:glucokinase
MRARYSSGSSQESKSGTWEKPLIGAVDIGGTKIAVGMIDGGGKVLARLEFATHADRGYQDALRRIEEALRAAAETANTQISGIGIGSTGPVYPLTGEIGDVNFFPHWKGENPVRDLSNLFHASVAIENDADAAALAEAGWGSGQNKDRLIYVTVGTGIGTSIVLDGELYRGANYAHPEIGHHAIDPSGPLCLCGFRGCWESLAAGPAMVAWLESEAPPDYPHRNDLTAKRICELAIEGDGLAKRAVDREAYYLGLGIANLVTLFAPDAIVLGGSVMKSAALFLETIRRMIGASCRFVPFDRVELALASLGEDANLIGAARVWHYRFGREGHQSGR